MSSPLTKPNSRLTTRRRRAQGFTLIEAALTMVIVGTGVLAMVSAQQAYHIRNEWAQRTGTAQMLANEVREITLVMPHHDPITGDANLGPESNEEGGTPDPQVDVVNYDDLDDFAGTINGAGNGAGVTFNPPINGLRLTIDDLDQWSQVVTVQKVLPEDVDLTLPLTTDSDFMRVTVSVRYQGPQMGVPEEVTSLTWVVSD